ncbi:MAG: hypothetical protein O3B41_08290 [Bacteroidetes bacterium]|nr:hypothetical protein [Bacteroidota bacterium]
MVVFGCDSSISGSAFENQPPDTQLSVQDESLLDNLDDDNRLTSTVQVSWSGDDSDGFVQGYEVRFFDRGESGEGVAWSYTVRTDSLFLLPIRPGQRISDVVFEARAIDNDGAPDPTPASTIFPVQNSPPQIRFIQFDLPPDTTFNVVSFGWAATDPDGNNNLSRVDVSFNDSLNFVSLPADVDFATFVADSAPSGSSGTLESRVFLGRGFSSSQIRVPGLIPNANNVVYLRSVDQTDTTSTRIEFTWYVKAKSADVLYINDYRRSTHTQITGFHLSLLKEFMPVNTPVDTWNITLPFVTGSTGNTPRSTLLPPNAQPTLRQFLASYKYIYWVSSNSTDRIDGNNLPFAAAVMDLFFTNGGKLMVHTPIGIPPDPEQILDNAAVVLLPLTTMVSFPDSLRPSLRMTQGARITAGGRTLPSTSQPLPELKSNAFLTNTLPYIATGSNIIPLYTVDYSYVTRTGRLGPWTGSSVVASISADLRIGLFTLPVINDQTSAQLLIGQTGSVDAPRLALKLMLESLGFPKR